MMISATVMSSGLPSGCHSLTGHPDGTPGLFDSVNEDNDVTWFDIPEGAPEDPSFAHGGKNGYDDRPMREYLVEFK